MSYIAKECVMKKVLMMVSLSLLAACASSPPEEKSQEVSVAMSATDKTKSQLPELEEYVVERNDTLMFIAFKLYGDYERWRELLLVNENLDYRRLETGQTLFYQPDEVPFVWEMKGTPHLIRPGETLGTISQKYYQTTGRWRDIYNNNLQMIKNPNLIFAGFTLYVPSKDRMAME
jgi:nucleoid-associated protein YgaU